MTNCEKLITIVIYYNCIFITIVYLYSNSYDSNVKGPSVTLPPVRIFAAFFPWFGGKVTDGGVYILQETRAYSLKFELETN